MLRMAPPHVAAKLSESLCDIDFAVVAAHGAGTSISVIATNEPWQPALLQACEWLRNRAVDPAQAKLALAVAPELRPEMRSFWSGCAAALQLQPSCAPHPTPVAA